MEDRKVVDSKESNIIVVASFSTNAKCHYNTVCVVCLVCVVCGGGGGTTPLPTEFGEIGRRGLSKKQSALFPHRSKGRVTSHELNIQLCAPRFPVLFPRARQFPRAAHLT